MQLIMGVTFKILYLLYFMGGLFLMFLLINYMGKSLEPIRKETKEEKE